MTLALAQHARRHATVALTGLVITGLALRYGAGGSLLFLTLLAWAFFALLAYALLACAAWAVDAWRHRKPDPWAYDPELDGPIAQEFEGRSFLLPPDLTPNATRNPDNRPAATAGWILLALAMFLAGAWLVGLAGRVYGAANGAEAPSLQALLLYLLAATLLAAGPCTAWIALAGAGRARP